MPYPALCLRESPIGEAMTCTHCKQPIESVNVLCVGWCRLDLHTGDCLALHVRSCQPCRVHNEGFLAAQRPK